MHTQSQHVAAIDCGELADPANGNVTLTGTGFEDEATYTCDDGHILSGNSPRVCMANAMWSGSEPVCEGMHESGCHPNGLLFLGPP